MIHGLVLAGGRSVRFGREKGAAELRGALLLERPLAALRAGCEVVGINAPAASGAGRYAESHGLARVPDAPGDPLGPLSGVKAGLIWASQAGGRLLATAPCDTPFLPADMVARLMAGLAPGRLVCVARTPQGRQSLCALWREEALPLIAEALAGGAHPPVRALLERLDAADVAFDDPEAFANINTEPDLASAKAKLER